MLIESFSVFTNPSCERIIIKRIIKLTFFARGWGGGFIVRDNCVDTEFKDTWVFINCPVNNKAAI